MHRQIHQSGKYNLVSNRWSSPTEQLVSESLAPSPRRIIWQLINAFMVVFFLMAAFVQVRIFLYTLITNQRLLNIQLKRLD